MWRPASFLSPREGAVVRVVVDPKASSSLYPTTSRPAGLPSPTKARCPLSKGMRPQGMEDKTLTFCHSGEVLPKGKDPSPLNIKGSRLWGSSCSLLSIVAEGQLDHTCYCPVKRSMCLTQKAKRCGTDHLSYPPIFVDGRNHQENILKRYIQIRFTFYTWFFYFLNYCHAF